MHICMYTFTCKHPLLGFVHTLHKIHRHINKVHLICKVQGMEQLCMCSIRTIIFCNNDYYNYDAMN